MRSEQEMFDLIINTARNDERIRAVMLNGSRVNPSAPRDIFQDFDITYLVTAIEPFTADHTWINGFGEIMILQMPEAMADPPPMNDGHFAYLMQFMDGNRIDLTLFPVALLPTFTLESLSRMLLDKDGLFPVLPPATDRDFLPTPPTAKAFADCCNEFWWVATYVAKGLWRAEMPYAKTLLEGALREQLLKMLTWHVGVNTNFQQGPGKFGKQLKRQLEPARWALLEKTYADADYAHTWDSLLAMCALFRQIAMPLATHYGFAYPHDDDQKVSAHLAHVRALPRDATAIY
jgi:aminoglycoside 6-adenylyltransferase